MNVLIDTHSFLWFINGDKQLSAKAKKVIIDAQTINFISIVSLWEIAIKVSIGKLKLDFPFSDLWKDIQANGFEILPIEFDHLQQLLILDFHHRDPFDRIIIAQAYSEHMPIITRDANFNRYSQLQVLW